MNATIRLLATRQAVARSICGQIDRLRALDHDLLTAMQAEPRERQQAILAALGESDDALVAKLTEVESEAA